MIHGCLTVEALFDAAREWDASLDCVDAKCPKCGVDLAFQPRAGEIWAGYVGWGGGPYFSAMEKEAVSGLGVARGEALEIELGERRWSIPRAKR